MLMARDKLPNAQVHRRSATIARPSLRETSDYNHEKTPRSRASGATPCSAVAVVAPTKWITTHRQRLECQGQCVSLLPS